MSDQTQRFLWLCVRLCEINHVLAQFTLEQEQRDPLYKEENDLYGELEALWPHIDLARLKGTLLVPSR